MTIMAEPTMTRAQARREAVRRWGAKVILEYHPNAPTPTDEERKAAIETLQGREYYRSPARRAMTLAERYADRDRLESIAYSWRCQASKPTNSIMGLPTVIGLAHGNSWEDMFARADAARQS